MLFAFCGGHFETDRRARSGTSCVGSENEKSSEIIKYSNDQPRNSSKFETRTSSIFHQNLFLSRRHIEVNICNLISPISCQLWNIFPSVWTALFRLMSLPVRGHGS